MGATEWRLRNSLTASVSKCLADRCTLGFHLGELPRRVSATRWEGLFIPATSQITTVFLLMSGLFDRLPEEAPLISVDLPAAGGVTA